MCNWRGAKIFFLCVCVKISICRFVNVSVLESSWMTIFLGSIGFQPQTTNLLYLPSDSLDPSLLSTALAIIEGLEQAVTRGAIYGGR